MRLDPYYGRLLELKGAVIEVPWPWEMGHSNKEFTTKNKQTKRNRMSESSEVKQRPQAERTMLQEFGEYINNGDVKEKFEAFYRSKWNKESDFETSASLAWSIVNLQQDVATLSAMLNKFTQAANAVDSPSQEPASNVVPLFNPDEENDG